MSTIFDKIFKSNQSRRDKRPIAIDQSVISSTGFDRLQPVYTFSFEDQGAIIKALRKEDGMKAFFTDEFGGVLLSLSNGQTRYIKNPLVSKTVNQNVINAMTIGTNEVSILTTQDYNRFAVSSKPFGFWYLFKKDANSLLQILYNPIPRAEFQSNDINTIKNNKSWIGKFCQEIGGIDPICKCINIENSELNIAGEDENQQFCMNELLRNNTSRKLLKGVARAGEYAELEKRCGCMIGKCDNAHPLWKYLLKSQILTETCPSSSFTICNANFNAGRDIKIDQVQLEQSCGGSFPQPTTPPPTEPPVIPPTDAPTTPPPYIDIPTTPPPSNGGDGDGGGTSSTTLTMGAKVGIGVAVVAVLIIIIIVIYQLAKK
jgi:hypothetical protein